MRIQIGTVVSLLSPVLLFVALSANASALYPRQDGEEMVQFVCQGLCSGSLLPDRIYAAICATNEQLLAICGWYVKTDNP